MDTKRFEEARARAIARRKPLTPPVTFDPPTASRVLALEAVEPRSDQSTSSSRRSGKKRKTASSSASPSVQEGHEVELIDMDEWTPARQVRWVNWEDLEPKDAPAGTEFDLENIDSLWYRQLDYG